MIMEDKSKTNAKTIINKYKTADPFKIAEILNIDVTYGEVSNKCLGFTFRYKNQPVIAISKTVKHSNQRFFVLAHELCHSIQHYGLNAFYTTNARNKNHLEQEADKFAMSLLTYFYIEENNETPHSYNDLMYSYGFPEMTKMQ